MGSLKRSGGTQHHPTHPAKEIGSTEADELRRLNRGRIELSAGGSSKAMLQRRFRNGVM
jgi:hypothetical protein